MAYLKCIVLLIIPSFCYADMVWPALMLEASMFSVFPILVGLLIELIFIINVFKFPFKTAIIADVVVNILSFIFGIPLIPIAGIIWEVFPGSIFNAIFNWGTFNPLSWAVSFLLACSINALIEIFSLAFFFKKSIDLKKYLWLVLANSFSVGVALLSILLYPPKI